MTAGGAVGADRPRPADMNRDRWLVLERVSGEVDVLPIYDAVEHAESDSCACGPTIEPVPREDGSFGWLTVHHSLDGREHAERDAR